MSASRCRKVVTREPKVYDVIDVNVPGHGPHPAVVLHVEEGMIVLAVGSTTPIADVEIVAVDGEPHWRNMGLRVGDRTIFYEKHVQPEKWLGGARGIRGRCPPSIFKKLFEAMETIATDAHAGKRKIDTIPRGLTRLEQQFFTLRRPEVTTGPMPAMSPAAIAAATGEAATPDDEST